MLSITDISLSLALVAACACTTIHHNRKVWQTLFFLLTDAEMFAQQLPHQHLVEPTLQLSREERANGGAVLLQLAHHLAPQLPQEPLQEVLDGAEHARGVTRVAIMQLLNNLGGFSLFSLIHSHLKGTMLCLCYLSV